MMTKATSAPALDEPPPGGLPELDRFLCFALYKAHHAMNRLYKPILSELGLTYPQFLVMMALWEADDRNVSDLGEVLQLESNTLTPLLKRLEAAGLISRRRDAKDERQVRVSLTEAGDRLRDKAEGVVACVFEAVKMPVDRIAGIVSEVNQVTDAVLAERAG